MKLKKKSNAVRVPPLKKPIKVKRKSSDVEGESTVSKALKNVKKVLEDKTANSTKKVSTLRVKTRSRKPTKKIIKTKTENTRGIVYVGHIPHGFYEEQMKDYFTQFGKVTRVRVSRSKNTGKSRGYGYVEFEHSDVAKIAADTMNNYLMCGRLLKATYIPPEKQHKRFFAGTPWSREVYPKLINRNATNRLRNTSTKKQKSFVQSTQAKLSALEHKLKDMGIDLTFVPSDVKA
ncbi:MKI67 FHA domain-interacting nucleolar phosphoprotein-like [Halictus rubicundus]|uniref:MKI67 FHA domain-interacting nucleolar phosphoprotein-like n=1 Tax=Halictus rubicundus TaxID=77578 RepID=UPI004037296F